MKTNFNKIMNTIYNSELYSKEKCEIIEDSLRNKILCIGCRIKLKGLDHPSYVASANSYYNEIKIMEDSTKTYSYRNVEKVYGYDLKISHILNLIEYRRKEEFENNNISDDNIEGVKINKEYDKINLKIIELWRGNGDLSYGKDAGCAGTGNSEVEELFMLMDHLRLRNYVPKHCYCINPDKNDGLLDSNKLDRKENK